MSHLHGWGLNNFYQLGFEMGEFDSYSRPITLDKFLSKSSIVDIALGQDHTLFALSNGRVCSCGSNQYGQLGRTGTEYNPLFVESLNYGIITNVFCGMYYSIVLTDNGQVLSWGINNHGQLGRHSANQFDANAGAITSLAFLVIVQISCGNNHSLALTNTRQVYSWGSNDRGQLSTKCTVYSTEPTLIADLSVVPITFICCGGQYSFALSISGAVFAWGDNNKGQLGLLGVEDQSIPAMLDISNNHRVVYMCCGYEHTALLTADGGVFVFGGGQYGCLGHGTSSNQYFPMKIEFLMGLVVTQIACGSYTTFAFVPAQKKVYSWGFNGYGQLGIDTFRYQSLPQISFISSVISDDAILNFQLYASFDHIFSTVTFKTNLSASVNDYRYMFLRFPFLKLTVGDMTRMANQIPRSPDYFRFTLIYESIFSSVAVLNASFLSDDLLWGQRDSGPNVNMESVYLFMYYMGHTCPFFQQLVYSVVMMTLETILELPHLCICFESIRFLLILFYLPCFNGVPTEEGLKLFILFAKCHKYLSCEHISTFLVKWYSVLGSQWIIGPVRATKIFLVNKIKLVKGTTSYAVFLLLKLLEMLHKSNVMASNLISRDNVDPTEFYVGNLAGLINIRQDYDGFYCKVNEDYFYFDFPFIYNMEAKVTILNHHDDITKHSAITEHILSNYNVVNGIVEIENTENPLYFKIAVHRENVFEDTMTALLNSSANDMKRPLYISFVGEDAMDFGGVKKEFFLIFFGELLQNKHGAFMEYKESRLIWFLPQTVANDSLFYTVGMLCGLCIYNEIIVNLQFPPLLFKKLLGRSVDLHDLCVLDPSLGRGLLALLEYENEDFEDIFMLTFQINVEFGNSVKTVDLVENGKYLAVTNENKSAYVESYVDYLLNKSVDDRFCKFKDGFLFVVQFNIMKYFEPVELESLVVGNQSYDFEEWKKNAIYTGEYHEHHPVISMFWDVCLSLTVQEKKQFLLFLTGTDRIPYSGMRDVPMKIQPSHVDEDHLPAAHTCFNTLDLPLYTSVDNMRAKLLKAIEYTQGFGFI